MDIQTKLASLSAFGVDFDEEKIKPFMSVALTEVGERIEGKIYKLENAIKTLLSREGKYGAFENFYGATSQLPSIADLTDLDNPIEWIRKNREERYQRCFDVAHFYANGGAWNYIIGDIVRPLDEDLPLVIELVPRIIDLHPSQIQAADFPAGSLPTLIKITDALRIAIFKLSAQLPNDVTPDGVGDEPGDISDWANAAKEKLSANLKVLLEKPTTDERLVAGRTTEVAILVIVGAYRLYAMIKPVIETIVYFMEREAEEQRKQVEARKREYEREFGPMPSEIPHASDHVDSYEHNKDILSRTV
ncbi:hypothetical protein [Pseudomonas sp. DP-17]|uniref:hypothetical protein n=1 Tax=Pseudomonas sp. DP-17 TaxID=1580486 RepID=UPI001EFAD3C6|nr:hypothetical protein [Pseudomonas sp. DP-17]MCG8910984.1 hypothetical protein [Pseudomonas sp. DP-17]